MARNREIGRAAVVAREHRPSAAEADAANHARYREMLNSDIGPASFKDRYVDDGRPVGTLRLLLRPSGLFLLAVLAFLAVVGVKLWRMGVFAPLFASAPAVVQKGRIHFKPGPRQPESYVAADNASIFDPAPVAVAPTKPKPVVSDVADTEEAEAAPETDAAE